MRALRLLLVGLVLPALFLGGCVPKKTTPAFPVAYYPQCYAPFQRLETLENEAKKRTLTYTAGGAAVGAAAGAATGFLTTGKWQGALVGALIGLAGGGATGMATAKVQNDNAKRTSLQASRIMMGEDLANANETEIAALQALKCYVQEFENLQAQVRSGQMTKEEFTKRYAEIRAAVTELGKTTGNSQTALAQREQSLRTALASDAGEYQNLVQRVPTVEQQRAAREKEAKRQEAKRKRAARKQSRGNVDGGSSSFAITALKTDLDEMQSRAENDRYKFTVPPIPVTQTNANAHPSQEEVRDAVNTYQAYPDKVVQFEELEMKRQQALKVMDEAANQTGIDMV